MKRTMMFFWATMLMSTVSYAAVASDYLILQKIGSYRLTRGYMSMGVRVNDKPMVREGGSEVEGTYTSYKTVYIGEGEEGLPRPFAKIKVYQSTQWLEHKLQREFRDTVDDETLGMRDPSSVIEKIGNSWAFTAFSGGGAYAWLHNNLWVEINYPDLQLVKPEPLEVVEAYLQKWPPTYPTESTKLIAGTEQWIKDEMEYLLWSSERWFVQYDAGKETLKEAMWEVKDKLDDFLRYRAKYFDENLDEERIAVKNADEPTLRTKLKEYQQWLAENKDKALVGL